MDFQSRANKLLDSMKTKEVTITTKKSIIFEQVCNTARFPTSRENLRNSPNKKIRLTK